MKKRQTEPCEYISMMPKSAMTEKSWQTNNNPKKEGTDSSHIKSDGYYGEKWKEKYKKGQEGFHEDMSFLSGTRDEQNKRIEILENIKE